ncbi:MAG TPA: hypothetical protein EYP92_08220 [Candidatus Thioglobus sp.]|nr:hypothetical protein [Candidatus Thioglobus sp.]
MTRIRSVFTIIISLCMLSGCLVAPITASVRLDQGAIANEAKKQREIALKDQFKQFKKLQSASWPLLEANADLCGDDTRPSLGFYAASVYSFKDKDEQLAARGALNMDSNTRFLIIYPGSPVENSGIEVGDIIHSINGKIIPSTPEGNSIFRETLKSNKGIDVWNIEVVKKDGGGESFLINTTQICDYGVVLSGDDNVNAYADGKNIYLTQGMIRFAETDQELNLIISHEIAHNLMGHIGAKKTNYALGTILDVIAAVYGIDTQNAIGKATGSAYSKQFEAEADYVGLYVMAKAGYQVSGAADFWRRMAALHPGSIATNHGASHPATPERFLSIEKSAVEINNKLIANKPLVFDLKPRKKAPEEAAPKVFGAH